MKDKFFNVIMTLMLSAIIIVLLTNLLACRPFKLNSVKIVEDPNNVSTTIILEKD